MDAVSKPGADCDTDHQMVTAKLRMKTDRNKNKGNVTKKYDIESLNDPEIAHQYNVETENRFNLLIGQNFENDTPNVLWEQLKETWCSVAESTIGFKKAKKNKPWISTEVLDLADEERKARKNSDMVNYKRLKSLLKTTVRRVKNAWLADQCDRIQNSHNIKYAKVLFNTVKKTRQQNFKA